MSKILLAAALLGFAGAVVPFEGNAITQEEYLGGELPLKITPGNGETVNEIRWVTINPSRNGNLDLSDPSLRGTLEGPNITRDVAPKYDEFSQFINFTFDPVVTTPGEYTFTIPAGLFCAHREVNGEWEENPEIVFHYTVEAPIPVPPNPLLKIETIPAAGSTVANLNELTVFFPDTDEAGAELVWLNGPTMVKVVDGKEVEEWNVLRWVYGETDGKLDKRKTVITFSRLIDQPGDYVFKIPAESWRCTWWVDSENTKKGGGYHYNQDFSCKFTIGTLPKDLVTLDVYECTPAAGSTVGSLSTVKIRFPQCNAPSQGVDAANTDYTEISMYNVVTNEAFYCYDCVYDDDKESLTLYFPDIRWDGQYKLRVPKGVWAIAGSDPEIVNPGFNVPYTLERGTDVEFTLGEERGDVLDLSGRVMMRDAVEADLMTLDKGIYIWNGKKIVR